MKEVCGENALRLLSPNGISLWYSENQHRVSGRWNLLGLRFEWPSGWGKRDKFFQWKKTTIPKSRLGISWGDLNETGI
jgi:hypothetical protein